MRKIKLRVWDNRNKVMITQDNYDELDYNSLANEWYDLHTFPYERDEWYPASSIQSFFELPEHEDLKVMQFTGIEDYAENEIFEGDILEDLATKKRYEIIWDEFAGMFLFNPLGTEGEGMDYYEFESTVGMTTILVIGNIYENEGLK